MMGRWNRYHLIRLE